MLPIPPVVAIPPMTGAAMEGRTHVCPMAVWADSNRNPDQDTGKAREDTGKRVGDHAHLLLLDADDPGSFMAVADGVDLAAEDRFCRQEQGDGKNPHKEIYGHRYLEQRPGAEKRHIFRKARDGSSPCDKEVQSRERGLCSYCEHEGVEIEGRDEEPVDAAHQRASPEPKGHGKDGVHVVVDQELGAHDGAQARDGAN